MQGRQLDSGFVFGPGCAPPPEPGPSPEQGDRSRAARQRRCRPCHPEDRALSIARIRASVSVRSGRTTRRRQPELLHAAATGGDRDSSGTLNVYVRHRRRPQRRRGPGRPRVGLDRHRRPDRSGRARSRLAGRTRGRAESPGGYGQASADADGAGAAGAGDGLGCMSSGVLTVPGNTFHELVQAAAPLAADLAVAGRRVLDRPWSAQGQPRQRSFRV
jgi:hypothetical protein